MMEPDVCPPPQDSVLDLSGMELCSKCKTELLRRSLKICYETAELQLRNSGLVVTQYSIKKE